MVLQDVIFAQVYTRLSERLGLSDHLLVMNVMLSKIATNLKVHGSCDEVITLTLNLFQVSSDDSCPSVVSATHLCM